MRKTIGIVGGMGTYAGIDLLTKIANNTDAGKDQDHLPVTMISVPEMILDRTEYLVGEIEENPGHAIADIAGRLVRNGAYFIGLPCNTAHVPEILDIVIESLPEGCRLINMIEEVGGYIQNNHKGITRVGVLATNGTYGSKVYDYYLNRFGVESIYPDEKSQFELVHPSIYDTEYGIKAQSNPVSERSLTDLLYVADELVKNGAEALILGCTEIPLALTGNTVYGVPAIDASDVLAKALVREVT